MRFFRFLQSNNNLVQTQRILSSSESEINSQPPEVEHLLAAERDTTQEEGRNSETMASSDQPRNEAAGDLRVELPPPKPDIHAPPPYEEVDFSSPSSEVSSVPYDDSSSTLQPPSYEEVQRLKALEAGESPLPVEETPGSGMHVVRISSLGALDPQTAEIAQEQLLGTDLMFIVAFTAAFLFNLVGIVLLLCLCHTVAGRTGALAGFGLSLAKWVVIFRHSSDLVADSNSWLLWLIMILGLLICVRAILQYINAKREWHQMPHNSRHRFFLFY
ncbi:UNVERIFIED_CONTAM: hypothetical protein RMT77_007276 [Armadillidium vulgare]